MNDMAVAAQTEEPPISDRSKERLSPKALEAKYLDAVNAIVEEARTNESTAILVDVLAWTLAVIIMRCQTRWGAGDVMRRIGDYVCKITDRDAAQVEAEKAKENGLLPH